MNQVEIALIPNEITGEISHIKSIAGTPYTELMKRMDNLVADAREAKRRCDELVERLPFIADLDHDSVAVHFHENGSMQNYFCALVATTADGEDNKQIHIVKFSPSSTILELPARLSVGKLRDISKFGDNSDLPHGGDQFDPPDVSDFNNAVFNVERGRENTSKRWDLVDDPIEKCRIAGLAMYGSVHQMMHPDPIGYLKLGPMNYPDEMIPLVASLKG